jgi:hypothetical protein
MTTQGFRIFFCRTLLFAMAVPSGLWATNARGDDVEIISPASNSTVQLPQTGIVTIKARFHNGYYHTGPLSSVETV